MIVSHEHRYVFVEVPRTGSSSISAELREMYGGLRVLTKHATYPEFARQASADELRYFVFAGVRNPLDDMVSQYFKLRTHHRKVSGRRSRLRGRRLYAWLDHRMSSYLERTEADFSAWFLRYKVLPYDSIASHSRKRFDYVIRFEQLAGDFAHALERIGLEPLRPLPNHNRTSMRERDFASYYTPAAIQRARRVLGPHMQEWGYSFPGEWGVAPPSALHRAEYLAMGLLRRVYWRSAPFGL
ncbi:MAG TPA: sulfotransferase family 2 domain-containing protein [Candidatus Limnocylindrales bacterium]|jgi:hypothetical protein